jgi:hypothetical protein
LHIHQAAARTGKDRELGQTAQKTFAKPANASSFRMLWSDTGSLARAFKNFPVHDFFIFKFLQRSQTNEHRLASLELERLWKSCASHFLLSR